MVTVELGGRCEQCPTCSRRAPSSGRRSGRIPEGAGAGARAKAATPRRAATAAGCAHARRPPRRNPERACPRGRSPYTRPQPRNPRAPQREVRRRSGAGGDGGQRGARRDDPSRRSGEARAEPAPDEHLFRPVPAERGTWAPAGGAGRGSAVRQGGGRTHEPPQPVPPEAIIRLSGSHRGQIARVDDCKLCITQRSAIPRCRRSSRLSRAAQHRCGGSRSPH